MKRIVIIVLGLFVAFSVCAQVISEKEINDLLKSQMLEIEDLQNSNITFIRQTGDQNSMIAFQQKLDLSSNQILTGQLGNGNSGNISQIGNGHNTRLLQTGSENDAQLNLDGNATFTEVRQTGNANVIKSNLNNLSKQLHSVLLAQAGNSNQIQLDVLGNGSNAEVDYSISIHQTGNELTFSGNYESNMLPVEIHQKSGATGEGMAVTVTTSAFYFPMK